MNSTLSAFMNSRKAWVLLLAIIGVVVMNVVGRIDHKDALDFIKWIVMAWLGAVAAEDAAAKHGQARAGAPPASSPPPQPAPPPDGAP
jgi:hypothetical protein